MAKKISTGMAGLDNIIDMLRAGDNVVWQVQSLEDYKKVVAPFVRQAQRDGRRIVYVNFDRTTTLIDSDDAVVTCTLASAGFEGFATAVYKLIETEGRDVLYVFDCLTGLLDFWYSDLLIGNFFRLVCPYLFQFESTAYFAVIRNSHTYDTIARIRETTQLLLDVYSFDENMYVHPLKVWERYSPGMFFPHLVDNDKAVSITASAQAAQLFAGFEINRPPRDYWEELLARAEEALSGSPEDKKAARELVFSLILGQGPGVHALCREHFTLEDLLAIAKREIGTGLIGGKSAGMLLARKIVEGEIGLCTHEHWEAHDSYYIGADVFYTYIVQNGWWSLRMRQKTPEGYFSLAPELRQNLLRGVFPPVIREQFMRMLEYFGQSPIIVRSSSLLEDNYGNAFAGKYESVFCANQGTPEQRYKAFEQAVRTVYASTMSNDALAYRKKRGLMERDEQMAILVQRVSGDHYADLFLPHVSGVGSSASLYLWDETGDPTAGMLRMVLGLGTRAVGRTQGDYARLVLLDAPLRLPPVNYGDEKKFSQHRVDLLDLKKGALVDMAVADIEAIDLRAGKELFFSPDAAARQCAASSASILDFNAFLATTGFTEFVSKVLHTLEQAYDYPVVIEFTVNFLPDGNWVFNLLQCRPLQARGLGTRTSMPAREPKPEAVFIKTNGNFMGGNVRLALDYIIFVRVEEYLKLPNQQQYAVARLIGDLNRVLQGKNMLLAGPGRWGTTTPAFGVPTHFSELCNMSVICEYEYAEEGVSPELSLGSHFFHDIVESAIFYLAVFNNDKTAIFRPNIVLEQENHLGRLVQEQRALEQVVHIVPAEGFTLYADVPTQSLLCFA